MHTHTSQAPSFTPTGVHFKTVNYNKHIFFDLTSSLWSTLVMNKGKLLGSLCIFFALLIGEKFCTYSSIVLTIFLGLVLVLLQKICNFICFIYLCICMYSLQLHAKTVFLIVNLIVYDNFRGKNICLIVYFDLSRIALDLLMRYIPWH